MLARETYKVKLTQHEAKIILDVICAVHDDNTVGLKQDRAYIDVKATKEESAALRRMRDALRRQFPYPD